MPDLGDDLIVVVPTRGRPDNVTRLISAFEKTTRADTSMILVVDWHAETESLPEVLPPWVQVDVNDGVGSVAAINSGAEHAAYYDGYAIGYMGDDALPVTVGWDEQLLEVMHSRKRLIVWPNDGIQFEKMATAVVMRSDVIEAWGYMGSPCFHHLCVDVAWADLARASGRGEYVDSVYVEHLHPAAGKAPWDSGYARCNSSEMAARDGAAYERWRDEQMTVELEILRQLP